MSFPSAIEKVTVAMNWMMLNHPHYWSIAAKRELLYTDNDNEINTACTNGITITFNINYVNRNDIEVIKTLLAHEILHIALAHHLRMGSRDVEKCNKAMDYAINLILFEQGFKPFKNWLYDNKYTGMSWEQIYDLLNDNDSTKDNNNESSNEQGNESDDSNGNKNASNSNSNHVVPNTEGKSENEIEQEIATQFSEFQSGINLTKRIDKEKGESMERKFSDSKPAIDWKSILQRFLNDTALNDYSYAKINHRYASVSPNVIMPSLYSQSPSNFTLAIDTSGSISEKEVSMMVTSCIDCLSYIENNPELTVVYCDDEIRNIEIINGTIPPKPKGGGGTDFAPVMRYALDTAPNALIYLTDGECYSFGSEPACPVLWVLIRRNPFFRPPFGEVISIY